MSAALEAVLGAAWKAVDLHYSEVPLGCPEWCARLKTALDEYDASPLAQPVFLRPQEGDVCVLAFPQRIAMDDRDTLRGHLQDQIPGVKVVIVSDCAGVQSFRPAKGDKDV